MFNRYVALIPAMVIFLTGCAGSPRLGSNVEYGDTKAVEGITNEFGSTDLQIIAEAMTNSLLQSPTLSGRPVLTVADVKNKTSEYIDTRAITDKIRTQLLKSGTVRFGVSISEMQSQTDELMRQNQSGLYKSSTAKKVGNMQAAQYRLEGSISSIVKKAGGVKDVFYIFNMSLIDIESGLVEWQDEKEIRKTSGN